MKKSFFTLLDERAQQTGSLLCVGLDPHTADLPEPTAAAARDFCLHVISATADLALAFKTNVAFFEALGPEGWSVLKEVIAAVPAGIPVILDAKRGDIATTAEAYADSTFKLLGAQAVTLNPYMGYDSLQPFLQDPSHGVFLLCKTSNPGSVDLQDLPLAGEGRPLHLFEKVAQLAQEWNDAYNLGLVVGATHPIALEQVRREAPQVWILAPGVGAQGADLNAALRAGLRADGSGLMISVSRAISRAADPRQAAVELLDTIQKARKEIVNETAEISTGDRTAISAELAEGLLQAGCVRFGQFTLKSGLISPIYLDMRTFVSHPELLARISAAYRPLLEQLKFDRLAALPYAALPIGTSISLQTGWPLIYPRKETKGYGTRADIEGEYKAGETVVVIDDLATTGISKFEAIQKLTAAGLVVRDVVVLIDREYGATEALLEAGIHLHSVLTLTNLLDYWEQANRIDPEQIKAAREFLARQ